ncbi:unnamed protein product [Cyclocybe aegerita]|uniref:Uncharacterized protein n=1 Tax=Cyclocybe aegerita TaxID=1973307 RepID=A0A8S0XZJ7_CYCAE|nr:unnamed protein product [Cyclocybe aegerita]
MSAECKWLNHLCRTLTPNTFSQLTSLDLYISRKVTNCILSSTNIFALSPLRFYHFKSDWLVDLKQSLHLDDTNHDRMARVQIWHNFLTRCTNLRVALISYNVYRDQPLPDDTVWMPPSQDGFRPLIHLTKLAIRTNLHGSASTLLRDLNLPALKMLMLDADGLSRFSLLPAGVAFVPTIIRDMAYFPQLTALCLARVAINDEDLFSPLCLTTELRTLSILKTAVRLIPGMNPASYKSQVLSEDSSGLISFLTINERTFNNEGHLPPLPHLRSIVLFYAIETFGDHVPYIAYARLAHSRYR